MKVHIYENSSGKDLIKQYIDKLPKKNRLADIRYYKPLKKIEWMN